MKTAIICFSLTGCETAEKIKEFLEKQGHEIRLAKKSRYIPDAEPVNVDKWTKEQFAWADGIVFVGACGIAVRHIAPYIHSKKTDPAVLVTDECGKFVISLLSGHLGGANELTGILAEALHAVPVITTATDLHGCFAVDTFARRNHCEIRNLHAAKEVSAALLAGKKVGFYSEFSWEGQLPDGLEVCDEDGRAKSGVYELGIAVSIHKNCRPFDVTITVIPRILTLGMGCRREKEAEGILTAAEEILEQNQIYQQAVEKLTSIDLKKNEEGFLTLAKKWDIPFETYSGEELNKVSGFFSKSDFVKNITGVDNVCERSAVLGSGQGRLIQKKISKDGVTAALAVQEWRMNFE